MDLRKRWLPLALAGLAVAVMVGVAELLGSSEILFPGTAALLCGCWIIPTQAWNVTRPRMIVLMCTGAIVGLTLNLFVPAPLWTRALMAYAFCALAMNVAGADMTPMVSAAVLPVLLGTESWVYPVAVTTIVCLICATQVFLERMGLRKPIDFTSRRARTRGDVGMWLMRIIAFAAVGAPLYLMGQPLFAVPPLIVAYTSLTRPDHTLRMRPFRTWAVLAMAALIGGCARGAVMLGLPIVPVVALAYCALVAGWHLCHDWLPPAGAVVLLALLVPSASPLAYVIEVSVGAALWVAIALCFPGIRPWRRATHAADGPQSVGHEAQDTV